MSLLHFYLNVVGVVNVLSKNGGVVECVKTHAMTRGR